MEHTVISTKRRRLVVGIKRKTANRKKPLRFLNRTTAQLNIRFTDGRKITEHWAWDRSRL